MNKIAFILGIFALLLWHNATLAQKTKFGHVDYASIVKELPETDSAQVALLSFKESLETDGKVMQQELETKYAEFQQNQATYSTAVAQVKQKELEDLYQRLQLFAEDAENQLQAKQIELLNPVKDKVLQAIKVVAEAEKIAYVFDIATLSYYWDSTDLTQKVKQQLGIAQ